MLKAVLEVIVEAIVFFVVFVIANSSGSSVGSSVGSNSGGNSVLCGVCRGSRSDQKGKNVDIHVQMREAFAQSPLASHLQPGAEQHIFWVKYCIHRWISKDIW